MGARVRHHKRNSAYYRAKARARRAKDNARKIKDAQRVKDEAEKALVAQDKMFKDRYEVYQRKVQEAQKRENKELPRGRPAVASHEKKGQALAEYMQQAGSWGGKPPTWFKRAYPNV